MNKRSARLAKQWLCSSCDEVMCFEKEKEQPSNCVRCGEPELINIDSVPPALPNMNFEDDQVNHPKHYTVGEIEVIDFIRDKFTYAAFEGYCIGNVMKYISRYEHKNGIQDLKKAAVYLKWAINSMEGDDLEK